MPYVDEETVLETLSNLSDVTGLAIRAGANPIDRVPAGISEAFVVFCSHSRAGDDLTMETARRAAGLIRAAYSAHGLPVMARRAALRQSAAPEGGTERVRGTDNQTGHDGPVLDLAVTLAIGLLIGRDLKPASWPDEERWKATILAWASALLARDIDSLIEALNGNWGTEKNLGPRWRIDFGTPSDLVQRIAARGLRDFPGEAEIKSGGNAPWVLASCILLATSSNPIAVDVARVLAYQAVLHQSPEDPVLAASVFRSCPEAIYCWTMHSLARLILPEWIPQTLNHPQGVHVVLAIRKRLGHIDWETTPGTLNIATCGGLSENDRKGLSTAVEIGMSLVTGSPASVHCDVAQTQIASALLEHLRARTAGTDWPDRIGSDDLLGPENLVDDLRRSHLRRLDEIRGASDRVNVLQTIVARMRVEIRGKVTALVGAVANNENRLEVLKDLRDLLHSIIDQAVGPRQ
jgi:hypothetical protein